jgi:hypothetical protein
MTETKIEYIVAHNAYYYDGAMWIYPYAPPHHTMIAPSYFNPQTEPDSQVKTVSDLIVELQCKIDEHKHDLEKQQAFLNMLLSIQNRNETNDNTEQLVVHTEESILEEHRMKSQIPEPAKKKKAKKKKPKPESAIVSETIIEPITEPKQQIDEWITPKKCSKPIGAPESVVALAKSIDEPVVEKKSVVTPVPKKPHKKKLKKQTQRINKPKDEVIEDVNSDDDITKVYARLPTLKPYEPLTGTPSEMYTMMGTNEFRVKWFENVFGQIYTPLLTTLHHYRIKRMMSRDTDYPGVFIIELPYDLERVTTILLGIMHYSELKTMTPNTMEYMIREFECGAKLIPNLNMCQWEDKHLEQFFRQNKINKKRLASVCLYIVYEKKIVYRAIRNCEK